MRRTGLTLLLGAVLTAGTIGSTISGCVDEVIAYCLQDSKKVNDEKPTNFSGPSFLYGEPVDVSYDVTSYGVTVVGQEYSANDCSSYATFDINEIEHILEYSEGEDGECIGDCVEVDGSGSDAYFAGGCGEGAADSADFVSKFCLPDYIPGESDVVSSEYVTLEFYTRDPDCGDEDDNVWTPGGDPAPDEWGETAPDEWVVE
jgi:hypothetical protein